MNKNIVDKVIISVVTMVLIVIVSIMGLSYSYFSTEIVGNDESSSVIITTKPIESSSQSSSATIQYIENDPESGVRMVAIGEEEFYVLNEEYCYESDDYFLLIDPFGDDLQLVCEMPIDYTLLISETGNIYNYDSTKTILLAKYNLDRTTGMQTTSTTQSDYAVPFSGSNRESEAVPIPYWYERDEINGGFKLKSKYGTYDYANNIYDTDYVTAPDYSVAFYNNVGNINYSVAYYVENYISSLGIEGAGRLLTYPEYYYTQYRRLFDFFNGQYYWLGTAVGNASDLWYVTDSGYSTKGGKFYNTNNNGVRPVLIVNTSDIQ